MSLELSHLLWETSVSTKASELLMRNGFSAAAAVEYPSSSTIVDVEGSAAAIVGEDFSADKKRTDVDDSRVFLRVLDNIVI